jgi:hypothetical protein
MDMLNNDSTLSIAEDQMVLMNILESPKPILVEHFNNKHTDYQNLPGILFFIQIFWRKNFIAIRYEVELFEEVIMKCIEL